MQRSIGRPSLRTATAAMVTLVGLALLVTVVRASPSWAAPGWSRVPHDPAVFGGSHHVLMFGVASSPSGFVAVGCDEGNDAGAVWWSTDGTTWNRVPHDSAIFAGECIVDVTEGPSSMVAVGSAYGTSDLDAAVWTGSGGTWSRVPHDPAVFGESGGASMRAVSAGGPGVVAVGSAGWGDAAVWTSVDGFAWTRVPHNAGTFGGLGTRSMHGVVAGGPGLVAVGTEIDGVDSDAAVWTSVDGLSWTRVPHNETVFGGNGKQEMASVTAGGPGLVAVGSSGAAAAIWTSVDGLTWARVPHDQAVFGGPGYVIAEDVIAAGPGLVAVGFHFDGVSRDAAVWTSVDGFTWERTPHSEAVFGGTDSPTMKAVTVDASGLVVAAGFATGPSASVAAVWTNDEWPPPPQMADIPRIPAKTIGPIPIEDPSWVSNTWLIWGIAALVLVAASLGWALVRPRR